MHCHTVVGAVRASAGRQRAPPPPGQKKIVRVRTGCAEFFKKFSLVRKAGRTEDAVFVCSTGGKAQFRLHSASPCFLSKAEPKLGLKKILQAPMTEKIIFS